MTRVVVQTHFSVTLYVKCLAWAPYCVNSWVCHITRVVIFLLLGLYFSYLLKSWHLVVFQTLSYLSVTVLQLWSIFSLCDYAGHWRLFLW